MRCIITAERVATVRRRSSSWRRTLLLAFLLPVQTVSAAALLPEIGVAFDFASRDPVRSGLAGRLSIAGALALRATVDGHAVPREISGLAWSKDDEVLYAVTDAGWLLQLRPRIVAGRLVGVALLRQDRLADADGHPLARGQSDAEGLAAIDGADGRPGNTRLLVSFEGHPLIAEHAPDGRRLRIWPLRPPLDRRDLYHHPNHGMEALALLPAHGYVVAEEKPLRGATTAAITLYAEDGLQWYYPVDDTRSRSITGLDTLPDGSLLAVERRYAGLLSPVVCTLSRLRVDGNELEVDRLAIYSSAQGWPVDNFEAIAVHDDAHFFIASDDNENPLQQALLIYLELPPSTE